MLNNLSSKSENNQFEELKMEKVPETNTNKSTVSFHLCNNFIKITCGFFLNYKNKLLVFIKS